MKEFESIWTNLEEFVAVWENLKYSTKIWKKFADLNRIQKFERIVRIPEGLWKNLKKFEKSEREAQKENEREIWRNLREIGRFEENLKESKGIWATLKEFERN